jgi:hypothetical protein
MPEEQKTTATSSPARRNAALDFTKGALVLIMVLYHWINYFQGPHDNRYLRFLTPSFICISGFLISHIYLSKYGIMNPRLPMRLITRGLKILGVFLLLNVIMIFLAGGPGNGRLLLSDLTASNLVAVFVTGNILIPGLGKGVAFYILVPISYLLMLSAVLLIVNRIYKYIFHLTFAFFLLSILILRWNGLESSNLEMLAIGLLGVLFGYIPIEKINAFVRHPYFLGLAYVCYVGAITMWNVIYPLQVIGVCLSLMILYLLGDQGGEAGRLRSRVILLGNYSLFGYIAQIAILQLLRRGLVHLNPRAAVLGLSFFLAFVLTIITVEAVDYARTGSITVDRLYKAVFA